MLPNQADKLLKLLELYAEDQSQSATRLAHELSLLRRTIALFLPQEARADYEALEEVFEAPPVESVEARLEKRAEIARALAEPKRPAAPPASRAGRSPAPQSQADNGVTRPPNRRFAPAPAAKVNPNVGTDGGL